MEQQAESRETLGQWVTFGVLWLLMEGLPAIGAVLFSLFCLFLMWRGLLTIL